MRHLGWLLVFVAGCSDEAAKHYRHAKAAHVSLVDKGERPSSKAFDEVLTELATVPPGHRDYADAQQLKAAIERAREYVRRPLASVHSNEADLPEDVRAQTRACAALAELLARDGGATPNVVKALDDCRKRIEKLDKAYHDAHEPPENDLTQRVRAVFDAGVP